MYVLDIQQNCYFKADRLRKRNNWINLKCGLSQTRREGFHIAHVTSLWQDLSFIMVHVVSDFIVIPYKKFDFQQPIV